MDIKYISKEVFYFLTICGLGLCCHSGDVEFDGKCYLLSKGKFDFLFARLICEIHEGDLAFINSSSLINSVSSLFTKPAFDHGISYWVKEDSYINDTTNSKIQSYNPKLTTVPNLRSRRYHSDASTMCPYLKNKTISSQDCNQKNMVICEYDTTEGNMSCPESWDLYGRYCYMRSTIQANYTEAVSNCSSHNGSLAVLDSKSKEIHGKSIVVEKNATYLVGAKRIDGTFKWSNCQEFRPACPQCIKGNSEMRCMGLSSDSTYPTMFSWERINCSEKHYFLCEKDAEHPSDPIPDQSYSACKVKTTTPIPTENSTETTTLVSNQTSTSPVSFENSTALLPETTSVSYYVLTTLDSLICPDSRWKRHMKFCYWNSDLVLNWYEARTYCQSFGGDLLTYQTKSEESQIILSSEENYTDHWFGLQRWRDDGKFRWIDGSPVTYTNWKLDEPKVGIKTRLCVKYSEDSETWMLDYCGKRKRFLCAAPLGRKTIKPDFSFLKRKQCNITTTSAFHKWYLYGVNCYLVAERNLHTWNSALTFCKDNGAHLVSIHSFEETNFILTLLNVETKTDFWIGLKTGFSSTWSDDTPLDFLYFANEHAIKLPNCVIFNKEDGSWMSADCNREYGVICKRSNDQEFSSPAPAAFPGNCLKDWYLLGNKCYMIFGQHGSDKLKWHDAKRACEKHGAVLATIHSKEEQDFLTDLMIEAGTDIWIGLQSHNMGEVFKWVDFTKLNYTNWNADDVKSNALTRDVCFEILNKVEADGKWKWQECHKKAAYVCQKPRDPRIKQPSKAPFECDTIKGWTRLGSSCYKVFNGNSTWKEAQSQCRAYEANLVSSKITIVALLLRERYTFEDGFYWIGVREMEQETYKTATGHHLIYSNWLPGQPQNISASTDNCVVINGNNRWLVRNCQEEHSFICEWNTGLDIENITERNNFRECSREWKNLGSSSSYIFKEDTPLSWNKAMAYCSKHGGNLASFHSIKDVKLVQDFLTHNFQSRFLHIGLTKSKDGSYVWVDHSPLDFTHWAVGQPDHKDHDCVEMTAEDGKWNDIDCDKTQRGFICSIPRMTDCVVDGMAINSTNPGTHKKLTIGGIVGITIGILGIMLVILALRAVRIYKRYPTGSMKLYLLENEESL